MRLKRIKSESCCYHVITRGTGKQIVFEDDMDYHVFLKKLREYSEKWKMSILCYCLMSNHVHMILYDKSSRISDFMHDVCMSYAIYYNKKYNHCGHVFEGRFKSFPIEDEGYLDTAFLYIIRNPQIAGICRYDVYQWSSFPDYILGKGPTDTRYMLKRYGGILALRHLLENEAGRECEEYDTPAKNPDEEIRKFLKDEWGILNPSEISSLSKEERDKVIISLREHGYSMRGTARLSGVSYGIIQRIR